MTPLVGAVLGATAVVLALCLGTWGLSWLVGRAITERTSTQQPNPAAEAAAKAKVLARYPDARLAWDEYQDFIDIPSRQRLPKTLDNWFDDTVGVTGPGSAWERAAHELDL